MNTASSRGRPLLSTAASSSCAEARERILEGKFDANRLVVIEFPSSEDAKTFYNSPEYQAAREKRIGAADFNMVLVEGA